MLIVFSTGEEQREQLRNEITDLRRTIGQEKFEKEAVQKTSNEMRNMVKKAESDKVDLSRTIQEYKQKISGLFRSIFELN